MDLEQAFRKRIMDAPAVAAIVGTRVAWMDIPQSWPLPNIRLQLITGGREQHLQGYFGKQQSRIRVECRAKTYAETVALAKAVEAASLGPTTVQDVVLGRAMVETPRDLGDDPGTGFIHRRVTDYLVPHKYSLA